MLDTFLSAVMSWRLFPVRLRAWRHRGWDYLGVKTMTGESYSVQSVRAVRVTDLLTPLLIYAITRAVNAVFFVIGGSRQPALVDSPAMNVIEPIPASPGYWTVLANWDGQWYKSIALDGYPQDVPSLGGAALAQSEWVFYPLYPAVTRTLMLLTGLPYEIAGGVLSLFAGGVAVALVYAMLLPRLGRFHAGATIAVLCSFPTAPILQTVYAESLTLLLLVLCLVSLEKRRYLAYAVLVLLLGLSRPITPPLLLVVAMHWILRARRKEVTMPGDIVRLGGTVAATLGSALLWPWLAGVLANEPDVFFRSRLAWRLTDDTSRIADGLLVQAFSLRWDAIGLVLAILLVVVFAGIAFRRGASGWGPELRTWALVYPMFLMLATQPVPSFFRYLLLAIVPWWPLSAEDRDRVGENRTLLWTVLVVLVGAGIVGQYLWVTRVFTVDVSPAVQPFP